MTHNTETVQRSQLEMDHSVAWSGISIGSGLVWSMTSRPVTGQTCSVPQLDFFCGRLWV